MTSDNTPDTDAFYQEAARGLSKSTSPDDRFRVVDAYTHTAAARRWNPEFDFKLTYYLAGPMKGYPEHNYPTFQRAAQVLRNTGIDIVSPAELHVKVDVKAEEERTDYGYDFLQRDITFLTMHCHGLILLKGWPKSHGARTELSVAMSLDFPIWFYDEYRLTMM